MKVIFLIFLLLLPVKFILLLKVTIAGQGLQLQIYLTVLLALSRKCNYCFQICRDGGPRYVWSYFKDQPVYSLCTTPKDTEEFL